LKNEILVHSTLFSYNHLEFKTLLYFKNLKLKNEILVHSTLLTVWSFLLLRKKAGRSFSH